MSSLYNKRILITAGPTWIAIDSVRVISNIATGVTGILLAHLAHKNGANVTLLLGAVPYPEKLDRAVKIQRFQYFDELKRALLIELRRKNYDWVIHSAAVSDYKTAVPSKNKISSRLNRLTLKLVPTEKLLDLIKKADPRIKVAAFKFETGTGKQELIQKARSLLRRTRSDIVVANTACRGKYTAYILEDDKVTTPIFSKNKMVSALLKRIGA